MLSVIKKDYCKNVMIMLNTNVQCDCSCIVLTLILLSVYLPPVVVPYLVGTLDHDHALSHICTLKK